MLCVALTTRWPPTKLKEKKVKYWFMNTYHCFLKFSSENRNCFLHVVKILLEKAVIGWPVDIIRFHPNFSKFSIQEVIGSNKEHGERKAHDQVCPYETAAC